MEPYLRRGGAVGRRSKVQKLLRSGQGLRLYHLSAKL